ncbi:MAG: DUF1330 domain-containing protein [Halioglobus sp.]
MSDVTTYVIANFIVHDKDEYRKYEKGFFPILTRHNGEFVTFDDNPITFEGTQTRKGRMVIFKFPNEDTANAWYNDPDYQALSEFRRAGTDLKFITMVHGLPPRG